MPKMEYFQSQTNFAEDILKQRSTCINDHECSTNDNNQHKSTQKSNISLSNGTKTNGDCNPDVSCSWRSAPELCHEDFLKNVIDMLIKKAVYEGTDRSTKVVNWKSPDELKNTINIDLEEKGVSHDRLLFLLTQIVQNSVKTGHPYFINQLYSSLDPYGLAGQWVTDALNPSVYTYEVAPVFTLMEMEVIKQMSKFVGYETFDGVFSPGGSIANMYAMIIARHFRFPEAKEKGNSCVGRLAAFTSEDSHYSIRKSCVTIGIGSDNLFLVDADENGRMDVRNLKKKIAEAKALGAIPFFVCATSGTTVLGAYDPIGPISSICKEENLWLHVDAAWGGGALVSPEHRHKLENIEKSDSVTWNPHKLLAAPQQCSVLLTKHEGVLEAANSAKATYLFQKDKFYDTSYDTGDKYIQCGRRADVLKFWTMWKAKGTEGLRKHIDALFVSAKCFAEDIKSRPGFRLLMEPECTNVCFWYEPPSMRTKRDTNEYKKLLHAVAPKIKEKMVKDGSMLITYQPLRNYPNFFRLVLQNSAVTLSDLKYFSDTIENLGKHL